MILVPRRGQFRNPGGLLEINWNSGLASGLVELLVPTESGIVALVNRQSPNLTSGDEGIIMVPDEGPIWDNTTDAEAWALQPNVAPSITIIARAAASTTSSTRAIAGFGTASGTQGAATLQLASTGAFRVAWINTSGAGNALSGGSYSANTYYNLAASVVAGDIRLYSNGRVVTTSTLAPTLPTFDLVSLGAAYSNGASSSVGTKWNGYAAMFSRLLSADEIYSLHESISQILKPRLKFWVFGQSASISGSGAITDADDTAAGAGTVAVSGSGAITDADDTASGSGAVTVSGSGAITDADDTASGSGAVAVSGSGAITDADDTIDSTGTTTGAISGFGAITDADDTVSASGTVAVSGSGVITDADDTASGSGAVAVSGSAAISDDADNIAANGTVQSSNFVEGNENVFFIHSRSIEWSPKRRSVEWDQVVRNKAA